MKKLATISLFICLATMAHAVCEGAAPTFFCYLDPDVSAGTHDGSQANPWQTVTWSSINTLLATGNVTVFMSAANAAHTASQASSAGLTMARTNTGTNVVTFDGISKYNTNDSVPVWAANVTPSPCRYDAAGCNWPTAFKYTITSSSPFGSNATVSACEGFFSVQGFNFITTGSQAINAAYLSNITVQFTDYTASASTVGPGGFIGPANNGPGKGGVGCAAATGGPDNVTWQYNHCHHSFGECLYVGASTPDPVQPATPNQLTEDPGLGNCMPNCKTGSNYLIQYNLNEDVAVVGGQGDGIDIKDGHTNLQVIGNLICPTLTNSCTVAGTGGGDGQGIVFESATLIDSNTIISPNHNCLTIGEGWNTATGRGALRISNNILLSCTGGVGQENAIAMFSPNSNGSGTTVNNLFGPIVIYSNSMFTAAGNCVSIQSGNTVGVVTIENNICDATTGGNAGGNLIASSDYNDYFGTGISPCPPTGETHSKCSDPKYVSTASPFVDTNFKVQGVSPLISAGLNLTGTFTNDYFADVRPSVAAWTIGAAEFTNAVVNPAPALVGVE